MFKYRSTELERIDTGDYTPAEYERFLREIAFINRHFGDRRVLAKTLFREIEAGRMREFSVLDVGAGSGELLRATADFSRRTGRTARLAAIDLNEISANAARTASISYPEITAVMGDALQLPFADGTFDYAISSLFFHHLTDEQAVSALSEMSRVAKRGVLVIDLRRHPAALVLYKLFCFAFRISPLVRHDGSLSILKGFREHELIEFAARGNVKVESVGSFFPYRVVLRGGGTGSNGPAA